MRYLSIFSKHHLKSEVFSWSGPTSNFIEYVWKQLYENNFVFWRGLLAGPGPKNSANFHSLFLISINKSTLIHIFPQNVSHLIRPLRRLNPTPTAVVFSQIFRVGRQPAFVSAACDETRKSEVRCGRGAEAKPQGDRGHILLQSRRRRDSSLPQLSCSAAERPSIPPPPPNNIPHRILIFLYQRCQTA